MLREQLDSELKRAEDEGDQRAVSTLRLVMTALNERDYCARDAGLAEGLNDQAIGEMLQSMVDQRRQNIKRCEETARLEFAEQEAEEIEILEKFLPAQMCNQEIEQAVQGAIDDLGATKLKDTGKVMSLLKDRYNGQMDFQRAKKIICNTLH